MKTLSPQPLFLILAHLAIGSRATEDDMAHFEQLDTRPLGVPDIRSFRVAAKNMLAVLQAWQIIRRGEVSLPRIDLPPEWAGDFDFCRATIARIFENAINPDHPQFIMDTATRFGMYGLLIQPRGETVIGGAYAEAFQTIRLEEKWGTCERCSGAFWTKSMKRRFCSESCKTLTSRQNRQ